MGEMDKQVRTSAAADVVDAASGPSSREQLKGQLRGMDYEAQQRALSPTEGVLQLKPAVQMAGGGGGFKWGNPKSVPTYGHTFSRHGQKVKKASMQDRARAADTKHGSTNVCQIGAWNNDQNAADFLATAVQGKAPGSVFETAVGSSDGRACLADGTDLQVDKARVVMRPNGAIKTAFPFSSTKQTDDSA